MTNQNKRYCEDLKEEAMDDPVYLRCQDSPDCNYFECREAIEKVDNHSYNINQSHTITKSCFDGT